MSGRPHRTFWILALLLYGSHPWLHRLVRGGSLTWVRLFPTQAAYATGIRVGRLRAALLELRRLGLIEEFHPYQGCWDVKLTKPTATWPALAPQTPQTIAGEASLSE